MQPKRVAVLLSFMIVPFIFITAAWGQEGIKSRMEARLPVIDALKARGIVGENNRGYLEFRGPRENASVVEAENADRAALFQHIAAQQGTTADIVGRRFAIKFRDLTRPGEWYQDDAGAWRKK
jgi:uncharacterized protein YdbL (DUF1318 family)